MKAKTASPFKDSATKDLYSLRPVTLPRRSQVPKAMEAQAGAPIFKGKGERTKGKGKDKDKSKTRTRARAIGSARARAGASSIGGSSRSSSSSIFSQR